LYCIFWTGAWNIFDLFVGRINLRRDLIYTFGSVVILFFLEELLSYESLLWIITRNSSPTTIPEGFNIQDQNVIDVIDGKTEEQSEKTEQIEKPLDTTDEKDTKDLKKNQQDLNEGTNHTEVSDSSD